MAFLDDYINEIIFNAVKKSNLKFWIINICDLETLITNTAASTDPFFKDRSINSVPRKASYLTKYDNMFKYGLISHTKESLITIFNGNGLELERIKEGFFK